MPAGAGEDAERFAAAVELGRSPGGRGDDELDRDLEIVAMLRSRTRDFDPDPAAKARAKQRLLAALAASDADDGTPGAQVLAPAFPVAADAAATTLLPQLPPPGDVPAVGPRPVKPQSTADEPTDLEQNDSVNSDESDASVTRIGRHGLSGRLPRSARTHRSAGGRHSLPVAHPAGRATGTRSLAAASRRFVLVGSAAMVAAMAMVGAGVLASKDALPGDGLYGVKRAAESAGLALTFDEASRAHRHLELASTRLEEVERLVAANPEVGTERPELVGEAIQQFDESAGDGARILLTDRGTGTPGGRDDLRIWASEQSTRLADLQPALPRGTADEDAMHLLQRVLGRTEALRQQGACAAPSTSVDDLGPVPSCVPAGVDKAGLSSPTGRSSATVEDPGPTGGAAGTEGSRAGTTQGSMGAAGSARAGTGPGADRPDPSGGGGVLGPVEDTVGGVLGGDSSSTSSPARTSDDPQPSDDERKSSDNGGGGSDGGISVDLPLVGSLGL